MSKSISEYEREIALLNLKLDVSQKALGFICDLARENPESAKFISDGTPFFAKNMLDIYKQEFKDMKSVQNELIEFVCTLYYDIRNDLGFPIEDE